MKVISFNTGYFLGYEGTFTDYLKRPWRSLKAPESEKEYLDQFLGIVKSEKPDFVIAQELDGGSIRTSTSGQQKYLAENLPSKYSFSFHSKYRGKIFSRMPLLRYMGNAVFYSQGDVENHSLDIGRKNLVQEIRLDGFSIFSLHLPTIGGWIRKRQLRQLKQIAEGRNEYVIAGDLNFHKGETEINYLEDILDNEVLSAGETFPAKNPHQKLDLVTSSKGIEIRNLNDLGNRFSDHRPLMFEVEKTGQDD